MREESGWSLIELMLVCVLLIIVMGGTLSLLDTSAKIAPQEQERAQAIRDAQVGLARMTRELRQATEVLSDNEYTLSVKVPVAGVSQTVTYVCDDACERTQGGATQLVVARVQNGGAGGTVFTKTGTNYFRVRIEVPAKGERNEGLRHNIVLDDGIFMRNVR